MSASSCRHIKEDGLYCQSPALRGREHCHFHLRVRGRRMRMAAETVQQQSHRLVLPPLEDMNAVQVGLMQVLDALAAGRLEERRAGLLLYGLQQAAINLRGEMAARFAAAGDEAERAQDYPDFETEFAVPPGADLEKPTEAPFPPAPPPPAEMEPSPYRESVFFRMQQVGPEDVELEEIQRTRGEEAYRKRRGQLQSKAQKEWDKKRREVELARYVVEAERRNQEIRNGPPEAVAEIEDAMAKAQQQAKEKKAAERAGEGTASLQTPAPGAKKMSGSVAAKEKRESLASWE